jgi:hypothetical protein
MPDFHKTMQMKEKAEEDRYFARRDKELIERLHEEQAAKPLIDSHARNTEIPAESGAAFPGLKKVRCRMPGSLSRWIRKLTRGEIRK